MGWQRGPAINTRSLAAKTKKNTRNMKCLPGPISSSPGHLRTAPTLMTNKSYDTRKISPKYHSEANLKEKSSACSQILPTTQYPSSTMNANECGR